ARDGHLHALAVSLGLLGRGLCGPCVPTLRLFFRATAPAAIYTLSLHDALPISRGPCRRVRGVLGVPPGSLDRHERDEPGLRRRRSEEHTSELQSRFDLVCRLLLEKKKTNPSRTKTSFAAIAASPSTSRLPPS